MNDCIFCKIANKEIKANIADETENVLAFHDVNPQAPVHILVIPKAHLSSITKVEKKHSALLYDIMEMIQKIAKKSGIMDSGFRIVVNCGHDAGQAVPHVHFHVLGGRPLLWPPG